ncbi:MAG TPA: O-antigen ligase family protein, partial [Gaiellaceae bacterium]|nr:O-antigen ligase family protein [Gaiellaceae bacterium]
MQAQPPSTPGSAERAATFFRSFSSPGTVVLALALPVLFLHVDLQPKVTLPLGSDGAEIALSDLAVLVVALAALQAGRRLGFSPLRARVWPFAAAALLLALIAIGTVQPVLLDRDYAFIDHALTAAKFAEYVLLALAVPLLVRTRHDLRLVLGVLILWTAAAAVVAVFQFFGVIPEFRGYRPGGREPSFLGHHDLAALAGAATSIGLASIALGPAAHLRRSLLWTATVAGAVGVVLSGALAGFLGVAAAALGAGLVARRRRVLDLAKVGGLLAVVAVTGAGVFTLRAANIGSFMRFLGIEQPRDVENFGGESYVQRLALGYLGVRIFADQPALGVGWQATSEEWTYAPYLEDTRRRYPNLPEEALPSPQHPWGIQNGYLQAAAELGVAGGAAFLAALLVPLALAWRVATRARDGAADAAVPLLWLLVTMGIWLGLGVVAGIP